MRPYILLLTGMVAAFFSGPFAAHGDPYSVSQTDRQDQLGQQQQSMEPVRMGWVDFAPYSYIDKGKHAGPFLTDTIAIFERAKVDYILVQLPIARLYQDIQNGDIHVWPGIHGHSGHDIATMRVEEQLNIVRLRLYGITSKPPSFKDLRDTAVIVIGGFNYGGLFKRNPPADNGLTLIPARDHVAAFDLMVKGRGAYVLDYMRAADKVIHDLGLSGIGKSVVQDIPIHYYISKKAPEPGRLLDIMQRGQLALMKERATSGQRTK